MPEPTPVTLTHDRGTVVVTGGPPGFTPHELPGVLFDPRTDTHRCQGRYYRGVVEQLIRDKLAYVDEARGWKNEPAGLKLHTDRDPFPHQKEAVAEWTRTGRRGCVILPTGTGKTFVAVLCMAKVDRPTLIVTPTLAAMVSDFEKARRAALTPLAEETPPAPAAPAETPPPKKSHKKTWIIVGVVLGVIAIAALASGGGDDGGGGGY